MGIGPRPALETLRSLTAGQIHHTRLSAGTRGLGWSTVTERQRAWLREATALGRQFIRVGSWPGVREVWGHTGHCMGASKGVPASVPWGWWNCVLFRTSPLLGADTVTSCSARALASCFSALCHTTVPPLRCRLQRRVKDRSTHRQAAPG